MEAVIKWFKRAGAFLVMVAGFFFTYQAVRHGRKQTKRAQEAEKLGKKKDTALGKAAVSRAKARTESAKADEALEKAQANIDKLQESGNEDLATRVKSFNRRMRRDRST